ncbi:DUF397 domain-containing protein [Streptomyces luteolus]|uniref:DUF397 domain-containing protein n=1 Tax=Streptomyces luteolus TaxID=3043615 RepID=A0ABT6T338_9ACTN|nr:DUF397 domain-containing protein [Streptomyces sp. B-S-A12]MDI3422287.1 DUF397 domain-containing protein [Streptomyces sp. B-S-A12]
MAEEPNWRTSSYTTHESCVEVADNDPYLVRIRDTKARTLGEVTVQPVAWKAFVDFCKAALGLLPQR